MPDLSLTSKLERWVAGGGRLVGEVAISGEPGSYRLSHVSDRGKSGLERFAAPAAARAIVRYDDEGNYRPLKSAPGLRRGWELSLGATAELHEALDYFYPAALAAPGSRTVNGHWQQSR